MTRTLDTEEKILTALTAVYAVMCCAFFCVGLWCFADTSTYIYTANTFYYNSKNSSLFGLQPGWTLVPCGIVGLLALPIALVAVCKPSKTTLIIYIIYVTVLVIVELPMTIIMLASWTTTKSTLETAMETSMKNDYVGIPYSYTHNKPNSLLFDKLMLQNHCCGINDKTDFTRNFNVYASVWHAGYRSHALGNGTSYTTTIPSACCMYSSTTEMTVNNDWLNYRNYLQNQLCPVNQDNSYSAGCFETLTQNCYNVISTAMGCFFIPILLQIGALIAAGVVYHALERVGVQPDWSQYQTKPNVSNKPSATNGNVSNVKYANGNGPYKGYQVNNQGNQGGRPSQNPNNYGGGWGSHAYK